MGDSSRRNALELVWKPVADSRLGPLSGLAMQGVLWTTVVGGALASERFTWPTDPFSIVGAGSGTVPAAFNLGLVVTGVLALPFAAWLWTTWRPALGGVYALTGVAFVFAGVFPMPAPLHEAAAGIFVFAWLLCWIAGVADWRAGARRVGALELGLGTVAVAIWLPYDVGIEWAMVGYGAAEAVSFTVLGIWTLLVVARHRRTIRPSTDPPVTPRSE